MFAARRDRLLQQLCDENLDAVLVTHPINVSYLTGFSGDASCLLASRTKMMVISDGRFTTQLTEECPDLEAHIRPPTQPLGAAVAEVITKLGHHAVGCESAHLTLAEFQTLCELTKHVEWKPHADRVERLRMVKDVGEIEQIRQAIRYAEQAFAMFRALLRPDDSEKDLADAMEHCVRRAGGNETAFKTIVAVGARAALPHAPPSAHRVREAPLLLVDWGAQGPFYKSDLTRVLLTHNNSTPPGCAEPSSKIREVYDVVLRAQQAAIATLRPGIKAMDVDAAARNVIAGAGYGEYFTHSIGHGIGMMIHEAPIMRANTEMVLQAGMVVTVEPGIYLPGAFGVRIEDDVLVTPDGCEVLTSLPKDIDAAVQIS